MNILKQGNFRARGSALLATLATIAALALVVTMVSRVLRQDQKYIQFRQARLEALSWAEAGIAIASHPVIKRGDPTLTWIGENGQGYEATIASEDGRLNISAVLQRGDEQLLESLFALWGMDADAGSALIDAMTDWIDQDEEVSLNGAEKEAYAGLGMPGVPPNRKFASVEEIRHVRGASVLDQVRPGWESLFTVHGSGRIDMKDASAELIAAACGVPIETAQRYVELRNGADGLADNEDDPPMNSVDEALAILGPPGVPEEILTPRVAVGSTTQRITSTGRSHGVDRTIAAIVNRRGSRPVVVWRSEVPSPAPPPPVE